MILGVAGSKMADWGGHLEKKLFFVMENRLSDFNYSMVGDSPSLMGMFIYLTCVYIKVE